MYGEGIDLELINLQRKGTRAFFAFSRKVLQDIPRCITVQFHKVFTTVFAYAKRELRIEGRFEAIFLQSFTRSDVNKRPLTDGWQTYM